VQWHATSACSCIWTYAGLSIQMTLPNPHPRQQMFVGEVDQVVLLINECQRRCACGRSQWNCVEYGMQGHVLSCSLQCAGCRFTRRWLSSSILGTLYAVNSRMVHGFTSSGLLTQQYNYFCEAAGIGQMSQGYIRSGKLLCCAQLCSHYPFYFILQFSVYDKHHYLATIRMVATSSMDQCIKEAQDAQVDSDNTVSC
jgi:hypothetical protein